MKTRIFFIWLLFLVIETGFHNLQIIRSIEVPNVAFDNAARKLDSDIFDGLNNRQETWDSNTPLFKTFSSLHLARLGNLQCFT